VPSETVADLKSDALHFHRVDNEQIIAYSKTRDVPGPEGTREGRDVIVANGLGIK